jgi:hypothetical protein
MRLESWVRWLLLLAALAALPILLHGCHGDEDHELFAPIVMKWHE